MLLHIDLPARVLQTHDRSAVLPDGPHLSTCLLNVDTSMLQTKLLWLGCFRLLQEGLRNELRRPLLCSRLCRTRGLCSGMCRSLCSGLCGPVRTGLCGPLCFDLCGSLCSEVLPSGVLRSGLCGSVWSEGVLRSRSLRPDLCGSERLLQQRE